MKQDQDLMGVRGASLLLILLLLPFAGCRRETRAANEPPPIEIRAVVVPAQAVSLTAQIDGQVAQVSVAEGAAVQAHQTLVQLHNPAVARDAATTRAQLQWIETRLQRLDRPRAVAPPPSRSADSIDIAARILALRKQRLDKMRQLRGTHDITARDLEIAEIEYLAALRDYNNERRVFPTGAPAPPDDRELLRIEREKAAVEQKFAAERRSLLEVTTPIAGRVTRLYVTPGQAVFPRDPIADVANLSTVHVRGAMAPELMRFVRPGLRVEVRVLSVPPRTFADEIESVIPPTGDTRTATVIAAIPNPDGSVQPNTEALITVRSMR